MWRGLISLLRGIPEPLFVAFFCMVPLLISASSHYNSDFVTHLTNVRSPPANFLSNLGRTIAHGEMYLYCFSLFGTLLWLCVIDPPSRKFRTRWLFVLFIVGIGLLSVAFYAIDVNKTNLTPPLFVWMSVVFYIIYLMLHVSLTVVFSSGTDLLRTFSQGAEHIVDGLTPGAGR
jgi:hypothetical protein